MNHMHQDSLRDVGGGSSPRSTSSLIQSMGDILMEDADTFIDTGNQISIASITLECHQLFKETLVNIQQSDEYDIFETQYGRLNIWATNIGAVAKDKSSLDHRLRLSDDIKSMILQLLEVLKGSLRQALDEGGDPNRRTQVFGEVIEAASASLDRLQNLATVIRKSSAQSRNLRSKALSSDDELNFKDFVLRVLKHRFKEANGSLCEQVAESVALRRKQFDYKIRHQGKLACPVVELGHSNPRPELSMAGTKHHLVAPQRNYGKLDTATREPKRLRLIAPLGRPCAVAPSETNASTLDTKLFRKTFPVHKAPRSIVSQGTSVQDVDLEYPPPPALALEHRECTCPYCCEILLSAHTKNERWWRHHIDTDLEPYSCISEKCRSSSTQFAKFQDWAQHMATHGSSNIAWGVHSKMFHCPLCESLEPVRWKEDFMSHMITYHAERFTSAQLLTLSRRSTITVIREPHVCPFCNRMPEEIERITPQNRDKMTELLPRHIAGHLRSLAFMALPYRDDIKDYESNAGRNQSGGGSATSRRISNLDLDAVSNPALGDSDNELEGFSTGFTTDVQEEIDWRGLNRILRDVEDAENIDRLYREDKARPSSRSSTQHGWDFLPSRSEEYQIEQDPLIQKFIASRGEITHRSSPEATLLQTQASDLEVTEERPLYMTSLDRSPSPTVFDIMETLTSGIFRSDPKRTDGGGVTSRTDEINRSRSQLQQCLRCALSFRNIKSFGDHMSKVHAEKAFRCQEPGCHAAYSRVHSLRIHANLHAVKAKDGLSKASMSPDRTNNLSDSTLQKPNPEHLESARSIDTISRDDKTARVPDISLPSIFGHPPRTPSPRRLKYGPHEMEVLCKPRTRPTGQSSTGTHIVSGPTDSITAIPSQQEQFAKEKLLYTCFECSATFSNKKLLRAHMSKNHNLGASICQLCCIGFDSPFNFRMHQCLKLEGRRVAILEDTDSEAEQPVTPPPVTPPLVSPPPRLKLPNKDHPVCVCPECGFSSYDIGLVRVHMTRVHDISPSDCGRCGTVFRDVASLIGHVCSGSGLNEASAKNPPRVTDPSKTPPRPVGGPLSKVPVDVDPRSGISPPVNRPRRKVDRLTYHHDFDEFISGGAVSTPAPEKQPEDRSSRAGYETNRSEIAESIESGISPSVKRPRRKSAKVTNYYDWDRYINGGEAPKTWPKDGSDVSAKLEPEMSSEEGEQRLQSETAHKVAFPNNLDTAMSTPEKKVEWGLRYKYEQRKREIRHLVSHQVPNQPILRLHEMHMQPKRFENNADSHDSPVFFCTKCRVGGLTKMLLKMHICDENVEASMTRES
ncbi:hypothetical protein TWF102_003952 [Orbilia oligospora]|uniref:C2H2-type domain-containing protein n=1 Tax=Orbilia oligospora TaxID=2813651 RepID=A0A7C8J927_ORBOL|nr:hypothetical protein TWF103_009583 [Orbilia oligospora]KAF3103136.1 hypothetical protein TWF102_003952 [Orbilia oligospora]